MQPHQFEGRRVLSDGDGNGSRPDANVCGGLEPGFRTHRRERQAEKGNRQYKKKYQTAFGQREYFW